MIPQYEANAADSQRRKKLVNELRELIAALDRRVPQIEREGEQDIARDSALLKKKAQERIARLENGPAAPHRVPRTPLWPRTKSSDSDRLD
ncbi:MAG TPA: hypothetical protein VH701_18810 [Vicinamibacterales bacterium]|jgi:hypothetical protein